MKRRLFLKGVAAVVAAATLPINETKPPRRPHAAGELYGMEYIEPQLEACHMATQAEASADTMSGGYMTPLQAKQHIRPGSPRLFPDLATV